MAIGVVFTVLLLSVVCNAAIVPVYLWGDLAKPSTKAYPLETTTTGSFNDLLESELSKEPFTVIFMEETLSVEDLPRKNGDGEISFPYLQSNLGDAVYMPAVEDPVQVLNKLADPEKVDHVKLTENGLSAEIEPENTNYLFINLKDAKEGETRSELLRRHNDFMEEMFSKLKGRYPAVVGIYTAHYPSWVIPEESHSRVRRQAEANANANTTEDIVVDGLRLYARNIWIKDGDNEVYLNGLTSSSSSFNDTVQNTTLSFNEHSIVLNFKSAGGYWFFDSLWINSGDASNEVFPTTEVFALIDFSYRCAPNVTFAAVNATKTLTFENLKVQPFFGTSNMTEFGDSFNCVGFFSAPIWSGLFVVFILLSITFYGIMMMMDIRTMDRFDDPKGKTITINAGE